MSCPVCTPPNVDARLGAPMLHGEVKLIRIAVIRFPSQVLHGIGDSHVRLCGCGEASAIQYDDVQPNLQSLLLPMIVPGTLLVVLPFLE